MTHIRSSDKSFVSNNSATKLDGISTEELQGQSKNEFLSVDQFAGTQLCKPAPVVKSVKQTPKNENEKAYLLEAVNRRSPPLDEKIFIKSATRTFNHTHEFAISDNFLWFRQQGDGPWQPLYFDGFSKGRIPIHVDCDGANLVVVDNKHKLHYKKVLTEFRGSEVDFARNSDLRQARPQIEGCPYVTVDISDRNNWIRKWFSLPIVSLFVDIFSNKRLLIPESARAFAISHRGRYNDYVEDKERQRHPVNTGVTTFYILEENGQDIRKYDPWSPKWAKTVIGLPETKDSAFVANSISVAASTIMAIGFETQLGSGKQRLKIITRMADIDTEGGNPVLKYSYFKDDRDPRRRVLPTDDQWKEHPLQLEGNAFVTKNITLRQIGEGNGARELRVEGCNAQGEWGYYKKRLQDSSWTFVLTKQHEGNGTPLAPPEMRSIGSTVRDYQGTLNGANSAVLRNFGARSNHAKITVDIDGKDYELDLYKRYSLANFFGKKEPSHEMVIPQDVPALKKIFGSAKAISIKIKEEQNQLEIASSAFSLHRFRFRLTRC